MRQCATIAMVIPIAARWPIGFGCHRWPSIFAVLFGAKPQSFSQPPWATKTKLMFFGPGRYRFP